MRARTIVAHPVPPRGAISFADFVDDALFHPRWGYYATGGVRFGTGGHYDTYPLALSPVFGHMVAEYAFQRWQRAKRPSAFEICELGAGNGQLCLDTLLWIHECGRHHRVRKDFADAARYRILERSPALIDRQRQQLGSLADQVRWTRANLAEAVPPRRRWARNGLIVANEVLDCLPHHKIVPLPDGAAAVAYVTAARGTRSLGRRQLAAAMANDRPPRRLRFREVLVALRRFPRLTAFLRRHRPDLVSPDGTRGPAYFACPQVEPMLANAARLYDRADALWIDYGATERFHRRTPESRRLFAGPPKSGAGVYDAPGQDDVTFMVDFSAVMGAARHAGWDIEFYGPQSELARRTRVRLDRRDAELIVRHRALRWLLAMSAGGPEGSWQRPAVSWSHAPVAGHVPVQRYVDQSIREFMSPRSPFKLLITRR